MITRPKPGNPIWHPGARNRGIRKEDMHRNMYQKRGIPTNAEHLDALVKSRGKWELNDTNYHESRDLERSGQKLDEVKFSRIRNGLSIDMSIVCKKSSGDLVSHDVRERWRFGAEALEGKTLMMWQMTNGLSIRLVSGDHWFVFHNKQAQIPDGSWSLSKRAGKADVKE